MNAGEHTKEDLLADIESVEDRLRARTGRNPTAADLAAYLGVMFAAWVGASASLDADPEQVIRSNLGSARDTARRVAVSSRERRVLQ